MARGFGGDAQRRTKHTKQHTRQLEVAALGLLVLWSTQSPRVLKHEEKLIVREIPWADVLENVCFS